MQVGDLNVELTMGATDFTVTINRAGQLVSQFTRQLKRTADGVERMEHGMHSMGRSFRNFMITIASIRFALMDFNEVILGIPRGVMRVSGELERMMKLMEGLSTASTEAGRQMEAQRGFEAVINMAKKAPFEIKSITDAFVKLKAGGMDPLDGSLQALIDGVAKFGGDSATLHRASIAIQQMAGKGVISMEELRQQLGEAMPAAMRWMARGMGVSMGELTKKISTGTVEAKTALRQMFIVMSIESQGAAERMMDSWTGIQSQMKTQFDLMGKDVGDAGFFDSVKDAAKELLDVMKSPEARTFAQSVGRDLAELVHITRDVIKGLFEMRQVIMGVGVALASVWGVTKLQSLLGGAKARFEAFGVQQRAMNNQLTSAKLADLGKIHSAEVAAANATMTRNAEKIARERVVYQQLFNQHAAHIAQIEALEARYRLTKNNRFQDVSTGRMVSTAVATQEANRLRANAAAMDTMMIANQRHRDELGKVNTATANHVSLLGQQARAAGESAAKISGMTRAANLLRGGIAFLGGPLWATVTVLSLMIPLWSRWANSGEDAIKKVRDAMAAKNGTREGRSVLDAKLSEVSDDLAFAEENFKEKAKGYSDPENDPRLKLERDRITRLKNLKLELSTELREITKQILDSDAQAGATAAREAFNREVEIVGREYQTGIATLVTQKEAALKVAGANTEAINKEFHAKEAQLVKDTAQREMDLALRASRTVDAMILETKKDKNLKVNIEAMKRLQGQKSELDKIIGELQARFKGIETIGAGIFTDKTGKVERERNPLIIALERATADFENAESRLNELENGADTVAALTDRIANKLTAQARLGKLTYKVDGKDVRVDPADPLIREVAAMQAKAKAGDEMGNAMQRALQMEAGAKEKLEQANQRLDGSGKKLNTEYARLAQQIAKSNETLKEGAMGWDKLTVAQQSALAAAANADMTNLLADSAQKSKDAAASMLTTVQARLDAEIAIVREGELAKFEIMKQNLLAAEGVNAVTLGKVGEMWAEFSESLKMQLDAIVARNKSPLDKLVEQWADTHASMQQIQANWANSFVEGIVQGTSKGRLEWKSFLVMMAEDMLRMQLQKSASTWMNALVNGISGMITGYMGGTAPAVSAANPMIAAKVGGVIGFDGSMPLQKYANGGIAKSPQMALFGEGSRPEAYVPLPDGRTIPVTMMNQTPGSAPTVIVNVINQTGKDVSGEQQGQPRFDGKQMILDVVLTAVTRPGGFRDGMKGAMKS